MQIDGAKIDEFIERLIKDNAGHPVTVELVCRIAGRCVATALNDFSKVPYLEVTVKNIEAKIEDIIATIKHSDGNVKLMTSLLDKYLSHNKMSDGCKLHTAALIEEYLEGTKDSLIRTITTTIDEVLVKRRDNNKFWMDVIKWLFYVLPMSGLGWIILQALGHIH